MASRVTLALLLAALTMAALPQLSLSNARERQAAVRTASHAVAPPEPARGVFVRSAKGAATRARRAASPRGHLVARVGGRTEFGSPRVLSVARTRGRRLGVVSSSQPNGRLAWVDRRRARLGRVAYSLHADLSKRTLELRRGDRTLSRVSVAVGRPGSPTPTGRFAVTDRLSGRRYGPYYGCCILALSGRQPNPPPGWRGGNRLAIHGTSAPASIGKPSSAGCLRAGDRDLRTLMRRVPLGTPVLIRR